jgi:hypothetical protein
MGEPAESVPLVVNELDYYVAITRGCCLRIKDIIGGRMSVDTSPLSSSFYVCGKIVRGSAGNSDKSIIVREVQGYASQFDWMRGSLVLCQVLV